MTASSFVLTKGGLVAVKFMNDVAAGASLNVNTTGNKPIYHNGSAIAAGIITAGDVVLFTYDGTEFVLVGKDIIDLSDAVNILPIAHGGTGMSSNGLQSNVTNAHGHGQRFPSGVCINCGRLSESAGSGGSISLMQPFASTDYVLIYDTSDHISMSKTSGSAVAWNNTSGVAAGTEWWIAIGIGAEV